ncbi:DinB family protein [Geothrix oryzisoli]|uniref:DinB family protein n=1 Tax=Geothrix oryzisoli TaxID=2922721 RepID=UPI001FAB4861|nr:DinB family protein [Geothrix oryzisoli]
MTPLAADLLLLFRRDLRCLIREVELFPDDATLWRRAPGITNSAGNVALHVAGNLQHFVGAVLGATGYVRQREREFAQRDGTRAEVVAGLEATVAAVETGLAALTEAALAAPFPMPIGSHRMSTRRFLVHLEAHLAFHLGQVGYLRRALTGDATSAGGMAIQDLAEP